MSKFIGLILGWFGRARNLQMLALILATPTLTIVSMVYLWAAMYGQTWQPEQQALQLQVIRDGMMWVHLLMFLTVSALTAGLVRSIKLNIAGKAEFAVDLADDLDTPTNVAKTAMSMAADTPAELTEVSEVPPAPEPETV